MTSMPSSKRFAAQASLALVFAFSFSTSIAHASCEQGSLRVPNQLAPIPMESLGVPVKSEKLKGAAFLRELSASPAYENTLTNDLEVMSLLNQDADFRHDQPHGATLKYLFDQPTGVDEGYSVGEHTARVLDTYDSQKKFYGLKQMKLNPEIRDIDSLLKYTLAFHDIGKSFAARAGDKSRETVYSGPMAFDLVRASGFNPAETKLSNALVWSHQILGNYISGGVAPDTVKDIDDPKRAAIAGIREAVRRSGIEKHEFFKLMTLVMTADAASYPTLREEVFTKDKRGELISTSQSRLKDLESKI